MTGHAISNDVLPTEVLRHGAYVCVGPRALPGELRAAPVETLLRDLGFDNEFDTANGHPSNAFALLRTVDVTPADLADDRMMRAAALIHVASPALAPVDRFCTEIGRTLRDAVIGVMRGVVRPPSYTGQAMHNFAYANQLQQQAGAAAPHAFLVPMRKTAEWFAKSWLERHTYLLPTFDEGRMVHEGHALAAADGVAHLMRRTYKWTGEPAPGGEYDFVNYFECADPGVPVFFAVHAALRDVSRNPEWTFVREGPTWRGRRVAAWTDLFK